jgi:TM2 domain-containing membrane protein YozV
MYSIKAHNGQIYGPADLKTIERWTAEGRIFANTTIVDHITDSEGPAGSFPLIATFFDPETRSAGTKAARTPQGPYPGSSPYQTGSPTPSAYGVPKTNPSYSGSGLNGFVGGYPIAGFGTPPKQKLVAALLAFFLGAFGVHQFYLGKSGLGIAMLLITVLSVGTLSWIVGIWALIDFVMILTGSARDSSGRALA